MLAWVGVIWDCLLKLVNFLWGSKKPITEVNSETKEDQDIEDALANPDGAPPAGAGGRDAGRV
jgi:hypothetical protein